MDFILIFDFERFLLKLKENLRTTKVALVLVRGGIKLLSISKSSCFMKKTTLPQANLIDRLGPGLEG